MTVGKNKTQAAQTLRRCVDSAKFLYQNQYKHESRSLSIADLRCKLHDDIIS